MFPVGGLVKWAEMNKLKKGDNIAESAVKLTPHRRRCGMVYSGGRRFVLYVVR